MSRKRYWKLLVVTAVLVFLAVPQVAAQQEKGKGMCPMCQAMGQGMHQGMGKGMGQSQYDVGNEVTVTGTIEAVEQRTASMGMVGTHLTLKTDEGTLDVHLGPSTFLQDQQFFFAVGDEVEIVGAGPAEQAGQVLVARQVKRGGETLILRDERGVPKWNRKGNHGP